MGRAVRHLALSGGAWLPRNREMGDGQQRARSRVTARCPAPARERACPRSRRREKLAYAKNSACTGRERCAPRASRSPAAAPRALAHTLPRRAARPVRCYVNKHRCGAPTTRCPCLLLLCLPRCPFPPPLLASTQAAARPSSPLPPKPGCACKRKTLACVPQCQGALQANASGGLVPGGGPPCRAVRGAFAPRSDDSKGPSACPAAKAARLPHCGDDIHCSKRRFCSA